MRLELPPPEHDPEDVRDLARQILAGPEYAPPARSWVERALDWIGRQVDPRRGPGSNGPSTGSGARSTACSAATAG